MVKESLLKTPAKRAGGTAFAPDEVDAPLILFVAHYWSNFYAKRLEIL